MGRLAAARRGTDGRARARAVLFAPPPKPACPPRGVTLVELMVALSISTLMLGGVIMLFANVTNTVSSSRATIEMSDRLRFARNRLQNDLAGHTVTTIPPRRPEDGEGYLEIVEGPNNDSYSYLPFTNSSGQTIDYDGSSGTTTYCNSIMGDADDVLMLTVRSQGEPFVGNMNGTMIESNTAEVIWFAVPNGRTLPADPKYAPVKGCQSVQLYTLYRRALLVSPTFFNSNTNLAGTTKLPATVQQAYDISVYPLYQFTGPTNWPRVIGSLPNTLETLTSRENRYYHQAATNATMPAYSGNVAPNLWGELPYSGFPFPLNMTFANGLPASVFSLVNSSRAGDDVILTDVLAFDIRVFDPLVPLKTAVDGSAVTPSNPGYNSKSTVPIIGYGGYVDLGYSMNTAFGSYFAAWPNAAAALNPNTPGVTSPLLYGAQSLGVVYDTWSWSYEQNGIDEDNDATQLTNQDIANAQNGAMGKAGAPAGTNGGAIDEGTDGFDDTPGGAYNNGVIDDSPQTATDYSVTPPTVSILSVGERETLAPYPFPLRGVQIRIRVYDHDSRQIREVKVVQDFLPD